MFSATVTLNFSDEREFEFSFRSTLNANQAIRFAQDDMVAHHGFTRADAATWISAVVVIAKRQTGVSA